MTDPAPRIRPCRPGDLTAVVDLMNAWDLAETGEPDTTADEVEEQWTEAEFVLGRDARVVETAAGDVVGYADVRSTAAGEREAAVFVLPGHDESPAGRMLLDEVGFVRQRLFFRMRADISCLEPEDGRTIGRIRLASFQPSVDAEDPVGAVRLYEHAGFRVVQRLDLLRRPPA